MSAPSPASEMSVELDAIARKKAKNLRYYYKNRERILAAQMVQRREDPEFQERQRVKEEAAAAALALKEAREAEKARAAEKACERERLRVERQVAKEAAIVKKAEEAAVREEKHRQQQEDQKKRREAKIREKAMALGLCLPPAESPTITSS